MRNQQTELKVVEEVLRLIRGDWVDGADTVSVQSRRLLPSLLIGVGLAALARRRLTKREAGELMLADPGTSGADCIRDAEKLGYITIEPGVGRERRKHFLFPTGKLEVLLRSEQWRLLRSLRQLDRDFDDDWDPGSWQPNEKMRIMQDVSYKANEVARQLNSAEKMLRDGHSTAARQCCDVLLAEFPDNKRALLLRVDVHAKEGQWAAAAADCRALLSKHRLSPRFAIKYARILEKLDQRSAAEELLKNMIPNCSPEELRWVEHELWRIRWRIVAGEQSEGAVR